MHWLHSGRYLEMFPRLLASFPAHIAHRDRLPSVLCVGDCAGVKTLELFTCSQPKNLPSKKEGKEGKKRKPKFFMGELKKNKLSSNIAFERIS